MNTRVAHAFIRCKLGTRIALVCALAIGASATSGQGPVQNAQGLDRTAVLNHLNAALSWYRDATNRVQTPGLSSDVVYQDTAQNLATQALRLAFQSANAEAALIDSVNKGTAAADNANQTGSGGDQPTTTS